MHFQTILHHPHVSANNTVLHLHGFAHYMNGYLHLHKIGVFCFFVWNFSLLEQVTLIVVKSIIPIPILLTDTNC
jgi:hypothetical protein